MTQPVTAHAESSVKDYFQLLKPRVMSLVIFTGAVGLYLAPGHIHPLIALVAVLAIALGSGAAGAINMWLERDLDARMQRTKLRPLPSGRILPENAIEFAVIMATCSVLLMAFATNILAAFLLLVAINFYVFVYTLWLKPRTAQNIVIGGAAGAIPPMIGWAAVTGTLTVEPLILFLIIFMWTPPHFWALALVKSADYAAVGIPMLPNTAGVKETQRQILLYTLVLLVTSALPVFYGMSGWLYAAMAGLLGAGFLYYTVRVYRHFDNRRAMQLFGYSILYLFLLFTALVIDKAVL